MKNIFIALLFIPAVISAQNYNAGSPVYDTLHTATHTANYSATGCPNLEIQFDVSFAQDPAGTQVYFKIIGGTMQPNSLHDVQNSLLLNIGDSVALTSSVNTFYFYSSNGSANFTYALLRCGIPTVQGDTFACNGNLLTSVAFLVDGCTGLLLYEIYSYGGDTCFVDSPLGLSSVKNESASLQISPNPSNGIFDVKSPKGNIGQIRIYNSVGELIHQEFIARESARIDLSEFANGIYFIRISSGEDTFTDRIVKE